MNAKTKPLDAKTKPMDHKTATMLGILKTLILGGANVVRFVNAKSARF